MSAPEYSTELQYAVLRAINEQCGIDGESPVELRVDGVSDEVISRYVHLLKVLDFVDATSFKDPVQGTTYFPIAIKSKGSECLAQTDKAFWKKAQDAATEGLKVLTGVDVAKFADFFQAAYEKYLREKGVT
ncbi:hypothetical protein ACG02S_13870 [Roseateles sp. DC23W]|uniref:DUF2513 domain-containing protein n=1 Tax=Pelomonas dachongensis TaxID=3299029 RepID=A0ABW7ENH1_9BURK